MRVKNAINYLKNFGLYNTCKWKFYKRTCDRKYQDEICRYVEQFYKDNVNETLKSNTESANEHIIWIFWAQGEKNMPSIVKICYKSILSHANGCKVKLLDQHNYTHYVQVEKCITEKVNSRVISLAMFSDILRVKLLKKYGGLWLDATVFMTKNLDGDFFDRAMFSMQTDYDESYISKGRWCVFLLGTNQIEHKVFCLIDELLVKYFQIHDAIPDYYFIDYLLQIAYHLLPDVKKDFDRNEKGDLYWLQNNLSHIFNESKWNEVVTKNTFFKLSYKENIDMKENTYYSYITNIGRKL